VLQPRGASRESWRFGGDALARIRLATRLSRDLDVNTSGVALALDLLDRIAELESRLAR
jgi:chaperone modulatory protein CbpM